MYDIFGEIRPEWINLLATEFNADYFREMAAYLETAYAERTVYPPARQVLRIFRELAPADIKVVILGQDPYHEINQANGLSFAVNPGVKIPPSLRNIYKELASDLGKKPPSNGDLSSWVEQGVFLLNSTLTVEEGKANSHAKLGWQRFTDAVIRAVSRLDQAKVFILWGNFAIAKKNLINTIDNPVAGNKNLILTGVHPSPLSARRGFFGSRPFSRTNEFLLKNGVEPIKW